MGDEQWNLPIRQWPFLNDAGRRLLLQVAANAIQLRSKVRASIFLSFGHVQPLGNGELTLKMSKGSTDIVLSQRTA